MCEGFNPSHRVAIVAGIVVLAVLVLTEVASRMRPVEWPAGAVDGRSSASHLGGLEQ